MIRAMPGFEELIIPLPDAYEARARYWPVSRPRGAVLYLHGIQSHGGWYERSARCLQAAGFAVLQPDRRGSGRNQRDRGHALSARQLVDDALTCADLLMRRAESDRCHIFGVSWGGRLACAMMRACSTLVKSLTLVCPGLFPRVDVSPADRIRIGLAMLGNRQRLFAIPLNDPSLFTSQPRWLDFIRDDPLALHEVTASFLLATRRMDQDIRLLPDCHPVPLHILVAGNDDIIDTAKTVAYARDLSWPDITITTYPHARHTLEFEPVCDAYCDAVVQWLQQRQAGGVGA